MCKHVCGLFVGTRPGGSYRPGTFLHHPVMFLLKPVPTSFRGDDGKAVPTSGFGDVYQRCSA
eukprot:365799-Chlamydomonas_euryale.AAC.7